MSEFEFNEIQKRQIKYSMGNTQNAAQGKVKQSRERRGSNAHNLILPMELGSGEII